MIELLLYLFRTVLDGRNEPLADGVQRALGCQPGDFKDYVQRAAVTGVWGRSVTHRDTESTERERSGLLCVSVVISP